MNSPKSAWLALTFTKHRQGRPIWINAVWPSRVKAERLLPALHCENLETSGLEARREGIRVGRDQCVANMNESHPQAQQTIASHERSARL
jgi:hypothetical protein